MTFRPFKLKVIGARYFREALPRESLNPWIIASDGPKTLLVATAFHATDATDLELFVGESIAVPPRVESAWRGAHAIVFIESMAYAVCETLEEICNLVECQAVGP